MSKQQFGKHQNPNTSDREVRNQPIADQKAPPKKLEAMTNNTSEESGTVPDEVSAAASLKTDSLEISLREPIPNSSNIHSDVVRSRSIGLTSQVEKSTGSLSKAKKSKDPAFDIGEPKSDQDLCDKLQALIKIEKWTKPIAERFIQFLTNPERQYQLSTKLRGTVIQVLMDCPHQYRSLVHLAVLSKHFLAKNGLRTLDGISDKMQSFLRDEMELSPNVAEALLSIKSDRVVTDWLKNQLNTKEQKQSDKLDLVRNLISYLLPTRDDTLIAKKIDIILAVFAGSNYLKSCADNKISLKETLPHRIEAILQLFCLDKPTTTESDRLILFGGYSHVVATQQSDEIILLQDDLRREREKRAKDMQKIEALENQCKIWEDQVQKAEQDRVELQNELDRERILYDQLDASSKAETTQKVNAERSKIKTRVLHELRKLELCFQGKPEFFSDNSQMGLDIIAELKQKLSE